MKTSNFMSVNLKSITTVFIFFIFILTSCGQELPEAHKESIEALKIGLIKSDYELFKNNLSQTFSAGSYTQPTVDQVIPQILMQYPKLTSLSVLKFSDNVAIVETIFEEIGKQESKITFNDAGEIVKIEFIDKILNHSVTNDHSSNHSAENNFEKVKSFTTKFELVGGLIFIQVKLNGEEEYFILDSGAPPAIVLNTNYFNSTKSNGTVGGVSGDAEMMIIENQSINWKGIKAEKINFMGMDLSHLEENIGRKFKGLIGYGLLKNYELLIDYKNQELTIFSKGQSKYHSQINPFSQLDFEYQSHIPTITVEIENKKYRFGVDTGAENNLISNSSLKNLSKNSYKVNGTSELNGANKNTTEAIKIVINELSFSNQKTKKMSFLSSDISHLTQGYNLEIDGLVGFPFLSKNKVSIDFIDKKINFWN